MTDNEKQFVLELRALSEKYKIKIGGCGCCGSPYLLPMNPEEAAPDAGYAVDENGDNLKWVVRAITGYTLTPSKQESLDC